MKYLFTLSLVLALLCRVSAQNLIPNASFEKTSGEPEFGCEFTLVSDWKNPSAHYCYNYEHGTPDLFSHFATGYAILPNSFMGTTEPHTGDRCAGIVTYISNSANHREYMTSPLLNPLIVGADYTVSFWRTSGNPASHIYHSDKLQVAFTMDTLFQSGKDPIASVTPQLSVDSVMRDSVWTLYTFQYTATDAYRYFTIGNFEDDASTIIESFGVDRPYAYHFIDDVTVEARAVGIGEAGANNSLVVYPNPNIHGEWNVQLGNNMLGAKAEVYDYSGKLVYDAVLMDNTNAISFDAASGVYVLKVKTGSNTITRKLIKL